ncbi:MAG: ATP synthase F1 subunit gamma [Clostridiales bacterium]|nr:ATP synthase F1 subunit gamma [Clostridiales bacterium]
MSETRQRIRAIEQTRQITRAMHLISSVKLKKAMERYEKNAFYIDWTRSIIKDILLHLGEVDHPFLKHRSGDRTAYLVIAGDKGMAGAFNANILNLALRHITQTQERFVFTVGHMASQFFNRRNIMVDVEFLHTAQNPQLFNARQIAEVFIDLYEQNLIDRVYILYTHMVSAMRQRPRVLKLLSLELSDFEDVRTEQGNFGALEYDPDPATVFETLVPQYIIGAVYATLVQSYASEQSSRMRAMDEATKNADEMIERLQQEYRRARQAAVTEEMIEVIGGTNAVRRADGRI